MTPFRSLFSLLVLLAHFALSAKGEPLLPPVEKWELDRAEWFRRNEVKELATRVLYESVRAVSPPVPVQPGQLLTAELPVSTRFEGDPSNTTFYRVWLELHFFAGDKALQVIRSAEVIGTQSEQQLALTGEAPANASSARVCLFIQNRYWQDVPNAAVPGTPRLTVLQGNRGDPPQLEIAVPFSREPGDRKARLTIKGNWPDGTAVVLSSDKGHLPPAAILKNGSAEAELSLTSEQFGSCQVGASISGISGQHVQVGDPIVGRVRIRSSGENSPIFVEVSRQGKPLPGRYVSKPGFFVQTPWEMELAPGKWGIRLSRGPHFEAVAKEIEIRSGEIADLGELQPRRVVDPRSEGWYVGDADGDVYHGERIYTDVSAKTAVLIGRALGMEWLGAGNWGSPTFQTWGEMRAITDRLSTTDHRFYWTDEQPKTPIGHICSIGMRRPDGERFEEFRNRTWDLRNHETLAAMRSSGAATFVNHPVRWWMSGNSFVSNLYSSLPFDLVAAGLIDGVNINEGGEKALRLWSLLLDHGYRVAATGGGDFCLDRPPGPLPGEARLYVHSVEGPSDRGLAEGIRRGHTIVSTGPTLLANLDGALPGSTVFRRKHLIKVQAWARQDRDDPLQRVELWAHGKRVAELPVNPVQDEKTFTWEPQGEWDWVAVRAISKNGWAMTSAFYAVGPNWKERGPILSRVTIKATGLREEEQANATVTCWDNWPGAPSARQLLSRPLRDSSAVELPVTATVVVRLGDGREKRVRLSEASGVDALAADIASGGRKEEPLLQWDTYAEVLHRLEKVEVTAAF